MSGYHTSRSCYYYHECAQGIIVLPEQMTIINATYQYLAPWLEKLPRIFNEEGDVIYDARNQIRLFTLADAANQPMDLVVKRFHRPAFLNRIIYTYLRTTKAQRAYDNACILLERGIATPAPVAYILCYEHGLISDSYLVTRRAQCTRLNREFTLAYTPELEDTIRPLARFTAYMHEEGILHLDYSPGNILWDKVGDDYRFEVIDINRLRIGPVSLREGCHSLRRLCARRSFFVTFADEYARCRHTDSQETLRLILYYRDRFWNYGKKANYQYD